MARLTVCVYDCDTSAPIEGALVHIEPRQAGSPPLDGVTDANGCVYFDVPPGRYDIEVSAQGYHSITILNVYVPSSGKHVKVWLCPDES